MAESTSTRKKTTGLERSSTPEARPSAGAGPSLSVRYWNRMRPNKVYPVVVSCTGRGESAPVALRLVMAGAQVVPAEHIIDPSNPKDKVTFYVTPLAKGPLRAEHLEVLADGRKIQELHLPCKVCTQRSAYWWVFLAFFIPWLLLHYFVYSPIGYQTPLGNDGTEQYVRAHGKEYEDYAKKIRDSDDSPADKRITDFFRDNTPDMAPIIGEDMSKSYRENVQTAPAKAYKQLFLGYHDLGQPLAWYIFWVLIVIAAISFWLNQEARKTVKGKPLPAGGGAD